jgi:hypothetical protein
MQNGFLWNLSKKLAILLPVVYTYRIDRTGRLQAEKLRGLALFSATKIDTNRAIGPKCLTIADR